MRTSILTPISILWEIYGISYLSAKLPTHLAPVLPGAIITFLAFFTLEYAKAGNFKLVPSYVAGNPDLVIWVNLARVVVISVLIVGFIQSYKSIKSKYAKEIDGTVKSS